MSRGLYALADAEISGNHSFVEAVKRYPGGVICLNSALFFHGIGPQMPYEIWMMRPDRKMTPNKDFPIRFVYCTGGAFSYGIETHRIEGAEVIIYAPPKTVADCFKYRNKIRLDVATEALKEERQAKHLQWTNSGKRPRFAVCKESSNPMWRCLFNEETCEKHERIGLNPALE